MRKYFGPLGWSFLILLLVAASAQSASYVTFYRVIGDWTVLCGEDRPGVGAQCSLSAPPPALDLLGARNEVVIEEIAADVFRVLVKVNEVSSRASKVTLRIDDFPVHEAVLAVGEAAWADAEATLIIREALAGEFLVAGVETNAGYSETRVSLIGFSKAIETYRRVVRSLGPL